MTRALMVLLVLLPAAVAAQGPAPDRPPSRADILRGEYGRYRANNDLLFYDLDVRVDPEKKSISGKNTIRFRMLKDDTRIQLDLYANLAVDKILFGTTPLELHARAERRLRRLSRDAASAGRDYSIDFHYSGTPRETGPLRRHRVRQGSDRPALDHHRVRGAGRQHLVAEQGSVARRAGGDGAERRDPERPGRRVERPVHRQDRSRRRLHALGLAHPLPDQLLQRLGEHRQLRALLPIGSATCTLDLLRAAGNLEKAKAQFAQARPMIEAFEKFFGEYPFKKDGYKLIEVPYSGMEHQSAVTYGNRFANGYLERDWTGVGVSLKFDFIIIHESAHEWFGNAVSAADVSDMWIQEGWTTYLESALRRAAVRLRRRAEVRERLQVEGPEPHADHHAARHSSRRRRRTCTSRARCSCTRSGASSTTTRGGGSCCATCISTSSIRTS